MPGCFIWYPAITQTSLCGFFSTSKEAKLSLAHYKINILILRTVKSCQSSFDTGYGYYKQSFPRLNSAQWKTTVSKWEMSRAARAHWIWIFGSQGPLSSFLTQTTAGAPQIEPRTHGIHSRRILTMLLAFWCLGTGQRKLKYPLERPTKEMGGKKTNLQKKNQIKAKTKAKKLKSGGESADIQDKRSSLTSYRTGKAESALYFIWPHSLYLSKI